MERMRIEQNNLADSLDKLNKATLLEKTMVAQQAMGQCMILFDQLITEIEELKKCQIKT